MSRKSQAFAQGQPTFTWKVERIEEPSTSSAGGRFKCSCITQPQIFGFGDTERQAINAAKHAMEQAVEKVETTVTSPGATYDGSL